MLYIPVAIIPYPFCAKCLYVSNIKSVPLGITRVYKSQNKS